MHRRIWLWSTALIACATLTLGVWAFWLEPASITVSEERIGFRWPAHRPLRVAILTDLHVGSPFNGISNGHVVEGGRHLFVATGVGTSILPVRFRVPPVVTILTLGAAASPLGDPAIGR